MHIVRVSLHEVFQALSDPSRVRILRLMLKAHTELCLCELSEALVEPEYKLSRHMKLLKTTGLISSARDRKFIYHSLVRDEKYLKLIYDAIAVFPDPENQLARDLARFKKRLKMREDGRCRQPSRVIQESEKAKKQWAN